MPSPLLSIVIPVHNKISFTRACVESLRSHTDVTYELIIIDNGSDPAEASAAADLADVSISNDTNLGFAAAMNQGLSAATGTYVAFVNNDTVFPAAWASTLLGCFDEYDDAGIVLPAVTAAGNKASVRKETADRRVVFDPFQAIPSGVIYVAERTTMLALGGWNENYGVASSEDLDLLFTFWANGKSVVLDERVLVHHESAVTSSTLKGRQALYRKNRLAFADRWATVTVDSVPRLESCSEEALADNLSKARIAGTWMRKWFEALDAAKEAAGRAAKTAKPASQQEPTPTPARSRVRRVLSRLLRR